MFRITAKFVVRLLAAVALLLSLSLVSSTSLKSEQLRDLAELLNDEEGALENEIEELEDIKSELLERSVDENRASDRVRKQVFVVRKPTPVPGEVPKRYTPAVPLQPPNKIAVEAPNAGDSDIPREKLPQTPKPPEKVEKLALPPTPAGIPIRPTPPYVPAEPNKLQPGPAFRPTPKYVWNGEKFEHVYPERKSNIEEIRERRFHGTYGVSCADIKRKFPQSVSGVYEISAGPSYQPVPVYCNMDEQRLALSQLLQLNR